MSTDTVNPVAPAPADLPAAAPQRSLFKSPAFWIALIVLAVGVIFAGRYWLDSKNYESTDDAFVDAHIVRLAPTVAGTLRQVADVDNRHVAAGQLLAVITPNGPEAMLAEADAGVSQAGAELERARAEVVAADAGRAQAAAQARAPLAAAAKAAQDLARYRALQRIDAPAVAAQQVDAARAEAQRTAAEAAAAQGQVASASASVVVAQRQVAAAQAAIEARRARVQQAKVTLGDLQLTAPVSGQVVNRSVNIGSYVAPGSPLMSIVPDRLWVTANFKETQLRHMRPGQPVTIKVDAFPDIKFLGRVDSIQRGAGQAFAVLPAQNATGNFVKVVQRVPVRIEFDIKNGPDPRRFAIGPGMSVQPSVKVH
ncbi:MAG: HlyD family secretion protein [Sphingomonas sp.]